MPYVTAVITLLALPMIGVLLFVRGRHLLQVPREQLDSRSVALVILATCAVLSTTVYMEICVEAILDVPRLSAIGRFLVVAYEVAYVVAVINTSPTFVSNIRNENVRRFFLKILLILGVLYVGILNVVRLRQLRIEMIPDAANASAFIMLFASLGLFSAIILLMRANVESVRAR